MLVFDVDCRRWYLRLLLMQHSSYECCGLTIQVRQSTVEVTVIFSALDLVTLPSVFHWTEETGVVLLQRT